MTRKQILQRLNEVGCDECTYYDIHKYLKANGWKLAEITRIEADAIKGYCKLWVNDIYIGEF